MFVQRITFKAKPGTMLKIVELLQAERERADRTFRIYRSYLGEHDRIAIEFDFESLAKMEQSWAEWMNSREGVSFMQEIDEQRERGNINEIWVPVE